MRKFLSIVFALLTVSVSVALCSDADSSFKGELVSYGVSSSLAWLIVSGLGLLAGHFAIPQKWASILYTIEVVIHWINEKTNRESKSQKAARLSGKVSVIVLLLALPLSLSAQSGPWTGFWKPRQVALNQVRLNSTTDTITNFKSGSFLFRGSAAIIGTATSIENSPQTYSFSAAGFGLSYGKYDASSYCTYSINAFVLPTVKLGDVTSTKIGGAVTVDVFNKIFGLGVGYTDLGEGFKWQFLTTFSYSF